MKTTIRLVVTSLESVVLQLQDSCREARNESQELRQENNRLRHEHREREKFWRALWQARKTGQGPEVEELPPPSTFSSLHSSRMNGHIGPHPHHYGGDSIGYRTADETPLCHGPYNAGASHGYPSQSPSISYSAVAGEVSGDSPSHPMNSRVQKYNTYPYPVHAATDAVWPQTITQSTSSGGDSGAAASTHSSHSPNYVESPTLTSSEMSYVGQYTVEEQKVPINGLEAAPYIFQNSRSISPTTSTPGSSSSSTSLSSFQFAFPDNSTGHDRAEYDFRRHTHPHNSEVTLHGGTADISLASPSNDAVRFRLGARKSTGPERGLLTAVPPRSSGSDDGSQHGSSDGESTSHHHPQSRPRRAAPPSRSSRSPSPGAAPLSGTLAVIKAQAFGALRRTRARTKKSSDGAAKVALDVLEARGIGMGVSAGTKRRRTHSEDADLQ